MTFTKGLQDARKQARRARAAFGRVEATPLMPSVYLGGTVSRHGSGFRDFSDDTLLILSGSLGGFKEGGLIAIEASRDSRLFRIIAKIGDAIGVVGLFFFEAKLLPGCVDAAFRPTATFFLNFKI